MVMYVLLTCGLGFGRHIGWSLVLCQRGHAIVSVLTEERKEVIVLGGRGSPETEWVLGIGCGLFCPQGGTVLGGATPFPCHCWEHDFELWSHPITLGGFCFLSNGESFPHFIL